MAFFKFRKGGDDKAAPPSPSAPVSVETMRKRARHRLIGAAVLVLLGVIGFPLLFDSQPRPIAVDIVIEIPDKDQAKRLKAPPLPPTRAKVDAPADAPTDAPTAAAVAATRLASGNVSATKTASADTSVKPAAKTAAPAPESAKPQTKADTKSDAPTAKAAPMIEERASDKQSAASDARYVVQVGAFADAVKAREVRLKLERAGLKTYTQVVTPKEGKRIRVRVGPFATKHDAEKAAEKIKKLDLPAGVLEL